MKKVYVYHVFRNEADWGRRLWFTFSNRKAALDCCDYYNRLAYSEKYNVYYDIDQEELYSTW